MDTHCYSRPGSSGPPEEQQHQTDSIMKFLFALSLAITAQPAMAQVVTKKSLTLDGARRVIASAQTEARKLGAPGGVIAVVDDGGNLMALERLDGTFGAG